MRRWEWKGDQQTKKEKTTTTELNLINNSSYWQSLATKHTDDSSFPLQVGPEIMSWIRFINISVMMI
jgi:hypothetical protein